MSVLQRFLGVSGSDDIKNHIVCQVFAAPSSDELIQGVATFKCDDLEACEIGHQYSHLLGKVEFHVVNGSKLSLYMKLAGYEFVDPRNSEAVSDEFRSLFEVNSDTADIPFWFRKVNGATPNVGEADIACRKGILDIQFQSTLTPVASCNLLELNINDMVTRKRRMDPCEITGKPRKIRRMQQIQEIVVEEERNVFFAASQLVNMLATRMVLYGKRRITRRTYSFNA